MDDDFDSLIEEETEEVYSTEKEFTILSRTKLAEDQLVDIKKISNILDISAPMARALLMHFSWNSEKMLTLYFEKGKEQVFKSAGVRDPSQEKVSQGDFTCPTCFDDTSLSNSLALNCSHRFCRDCWKQHVTLKIKEGQSRRITCMAPKCNVLFDETFIDGLVDKLTYEKFCSSLVDSFVEDNPQMRWCTSVPHCGNAVKVGFGCGDILCNCGHTFCFHCGGDIHSPCSCEQKTKWSQKLKDDSETANYFKANTKPCPKCGKAIEKDGGCNLVTCSCGQHMCWLCGAPTGAAHDWTKIEGHSCGKWKEEKEKDSEDAAETLKRFIHYLDRYNANDAIKTKETLISDVVTKKHILKEIVAFDLRWIDRALHQLFVTRRVLAHSYVFAFYMFAPSNKKNKYYEQHKNLFEDHQQQLELVIERLAKLLEAPYTELNAKVLQEVVNLTVLNDKRCKGLFDVIQNDILGSGHYGFTISSYTSNTEGSQSWVENLDPDFGKMIAMKRKREEEQKQQEKEAQKAKLKVEIPVEIQEAEPKIKRKTKLRDMQVEDEDEALKKALEMSKSTAREEIPEGLEGMDLSEEDLLQQALMLSEFEAQKQKT